MSHIGDPAVHAAAVVPSDTTILTPTRSLFIGVAGNITVRMFGGETVLLSNVPVGIIPLQVDKVFASGTAATNIVALW